MVCWQQAKMLYKYRASLHTRMRTHTPPDEQNQSSGTAELRVCLARLVLALLPGNASGGPPRREGGGMAAQAVRRTEARQPRCIAHPMCRGRCSGHFWRAQ